MPTRARHIAQAEHNEDLYRHLGAVSPEYIDWQVTCLFYAVLHYVDAYLAPLVHPATHAERDNWISREAILRIIRPDYRELRSRSEDARYNAVYVAAQLRDSLSTSQF